MLLRFLGKLTRLFLGCELAACQLPQRKCAHAVFHLEEDEK